MIAEAEPWSRRQIVVTLLVNAACLALLAISWNGTADELRLREQVPWLNTGILALIGAGTVNAAFIRSARVLITNRSRALLADRAVDDLMGSSP